MPPTRSRRSLSPSIEPSTPYTHVTKSSTSSDATTPAPTSSSKVFGKTRTSWVWKYGEEASTNSPEKWLWRCNLCPIKSIAKKFDARGTGHIMQHLHTCHRITEKGAISTNQTTLRKPLIDPLVLRKLVAEWIIDRCHAFNKVEAESFRKILAYIDVTAINKLLKSGTTIRTNIVQYFHNAKPIVIEALSTARSKIHLSFDLWTAPNYVPILGITGHWTTDDYMIKTSLLALREISGPHDGQNIGQVIYDVIKDFKFESKVGYFMRDNATNNDTAIQSIENYLQDNGNFEFNWRERRL